MSRSCANAALLGAAVLLAASAAGARPRARPPQSQPARAAATQPAHRVVIKVTGQLRAPNLRFIFARPVPRLEPRPLERGATVSLVEVVRRTPF